MSDASIGELPRIYNVRTSVIILSSLAAALEFILAILIPFKEPINNPTPEKITLIVSIIICSMLIAGYLFFAPRKSKIILHSDGIEKIGLFKTKRLKNDEIDFKLFVFAFVYHVVLVPRRRTLGRIKIELASYLFDDAFDIWLSAVPDSRHRRGKII